MRVMNTNTVGSFRVTQALYPLLKKRETRTIVNVSSGAGSITLNRGGMKDLSGKIVAYASSKAALNMRARPGPAQALATPRPWPRSACMQASAAWRRPGRHHAGGSATRGSAAPCLRQGGWARRCLARCTAAARPAAPADMRAACRGARDVGAGGRAQG